MSFESPTQSPGTAVAYDPDVYDLIAQDWRDSHGIRQFFDTNLTLGSGSASSLLRQKIQLQLADIAVEPQVDRPPMSARKARTLSEVLRADHGLKTQDGASVWEDYLTLVAFEYLTHVPPPAGPQTLFERLLNRPAGFEYHTLTCWPYIKCAGARTLLTQLGYSQHVAARWWAVEPDVLVEGPRDLVFIENKPHRPTVPDHGESTKLGELLTLGWLLGELGGKRFTLLAMTSPDGSVRLKDAQGPLALADASARAIAAIGVDPSGSIGRAMLGSVQPFTWPGVLTAMDGVAPSSRDYPNFGFYTAMFQDRQRLLSSTLEKGYRLGAPAR